MKIHSIHHIKFTVSNLERSKKFYEHILGFKTVAEYSDFIMLTNGYFYLGLTTHLGKLHERRFKETSVGLDHVSFSVESRQDLDQSLALLELEHIPHGDITKLSNSLYVLAFRDPDNIQLELSWKEK